MDSTTGTTSATDPLASSRFADLSLSLDRAAILDLGTAYTKVGFAGERCPRHVVPTPIPLKYLIPNANLCLYCPPAGTPGPTLSETIDAFEQLLRRIFFTLLQVRCRRHGIRKENACRPVHCLL